MKHKPWSSSSKWFVPFHIGIMLTIFIGLMTFSMMAKAYDENGDRYCLAQNIYFIAILFFVWKSFINEQ